MFVEREPKTHRKITVRVDSEMFYSLNALAETVGKSQSEVMRLGIAYIIEKARVEKILSWNELVLNANVHDSEYEE